MKYKGFFVKITPDNYLPRETENGEIIAGEGFRIEVFADESEEVEIDIFSAAVDFELIKNSIDEAEQFAKDYIDCEGKNIKGYWRSLIADNRPNDVENRPNNANMLIFDEINVTLNVSRNARITYKIILC